MKNLRLIVLSSSLFMSLVAHGKAHPVQIGDSGVKCSNKMDGDRGPQNVKVAERWLSGGQRPEGRQSSGPGGTAESVSKPVR